MSFLTSGPQLPQQENKMLGWVYGPHCRWHMKSPLEQNWGMGDIFLSLNKLQRSYYPPPPRLAGSSKDFTIISVSSLLTHSGT